MSNMENLDMVLSEKERQAQVYENAVASLKAERRETEAQGYRVMSSALGYGEGALGDGTFFLTMGNSFKKLFQ